jgi:hypothetical protein
VANKYLQYFLIIAVIGVWGAVMYRLIHGLSDKNIPIIASNVPIQSDIENPIDTFSLYADYPDPFLPDTDTLSSEDVKKVSEKSDFNSSNSKSEDNTALIIAAIKYNGIIENTDKKSTVGIITINGKEFLVKEKQKVDDIMIKNIRKDSVHVSYKGKLFYIKRID